MNPRNMGMELFRHHEKKRFGRIRTYLLGILLVSLAAQLGTLPITMYYFHQVSCYFLLTNLIVLPLASLLVPCGLLTVALGGSTAGIWVGKATHALAWAMNSSVGWIERLPGSTVQVSISPAMVVIYYILLLAFVLCWPRRA